MLMFYRTLIIIFEISLSYLFPSLRIKEMRNWILTRDFSQLIVNRNIFLNSILLARFEEDGGSV